VKYGDKSPSKVVGIHRLRNGEDLVLQVAFIALGDLVLPDSFLVGDDAFMVVMYRPSLEEPAYAVIISPKFRNAESATGVFQVIVKKGLKNGMSDASKELYSLNHDGTRNWNLTQATQNLKYVENQLMRLPKDLTFWDELILFFEALGTDSVTGPFKSGLSRTE